MRLCLVVILTVFSFPLLAQSDLLYVDKQGVLRRQSDQQEQSFFGVNYTLPFAYAYRHVKAMGLKHEEVIDADVYHFARLGLDAFRVHVWDTEISDAHGNLINNEHLRLFDYLIKKLKERNIKILITPIAYWGNGYPDKNEQTQGFSDKFRYNKRKLVTNDTAIAAQENYIKQLLLHVNPYTKLSYRDDPSVIACEINNEPDHGPDNHQTTAYINRMADAVRSIQWKKPIFYNISQAYRNEEAFLAAKVDGFTYQWYSNGLVANHTTPGNTLPYVDNYAIPYKHAPGFADKAKIIYEFDAADVRSSYMYPAMARSFRTAGFQWATQFAWDPTPLAYANTEYQTHYLNLSYTPAKAISFLIAGKAFHRVPRYKEYGGFPADTTFDQFRVSYKENLSELNTATEFYYSNNTSTQPASPQSLRHLAGVGNSPLVSYEGTGAYFLDRVAPGVWRLELMPDAVPVKDPFTNAALNDTATYIIWRKHAMQLQLTDLGKRFRVLPLNTGNKSKTYNTANGKINVIPGVYLLTSKNVNIAALQLKDQPIGMREFYAPSSMQLPATNTFTEPAATVKSPKDSAELELFNANLVQRDTVWKSWWRIKNFPDWNRLTHYRFDTTDNVISYYASADTFNYDIPFIGWQYSCNMTSTKTEVDQQFRYSNIKLNAAAVNGKAAQLKLILVDRDGNAFTRKINAEGTLKTYELPISSFSKGPFLLVPRPYPMFLPLWFSSTTNPPMNIYNIEKIQVLYMPDDNAQATGQQGFRIQRIWAE